MFGILAGSGQGMCGAARRAWMGHVCGACHAIRRDSGQLARATLNLDAVLLSVLVEAQGGTVRYVDSGRCALRGAGRVRMPMVAADDPAARLAGVVSVELARAAMEDKLADGDGWLARWAPGLLRGLRRMWRRGGTRAAADVGLELTALREAPSRQLGLEGRAGLDFAAYAAPTADAVAAACAATAELAGRPENAPALGRLGRHLGELVYLLDAAEDHAEDRAAGRFNPLPESDPLGWAAARFAETHRALRAELEGLALPRPEMAHGLLVRGVGRAGVRLFGSAVGDGEGETRSKRPLRSKGHVQPDPCPCDCCFLGGDISCPGCDGGECCGGGDCCAGADCCGGCSC